MSSLRRLTLDDLQDLKGYTPIKDSSNGESLLCTGRYIKKHWADKLDFEHYITEYAAVLPGYVLVQCDERTWIAVWQDPTLPELNDGVGKQRYVKLKSELDVPWTEPRKTRQPEPTPAEPSLEQEINQGARLLADALTSPGVLVTIDD